jgi:hypothetical protein
MTHGMTLTLFNTISLIVEVPSVPDLGEEGKQMGMLYPDAVGIKVLLIL